MTHEEAVETLLAMAQVQDGYAARATDEGLKLIHKANAKAQRQVAELLKQMATNLDAFAKANHLQANCLHLTAQALGPDYSATVDALPKAAKHVAARLAEVEAELEQSEIEHAACLQLCVDLMTRAEAAEAEAAKLQTVLGELLADDIAHVGPYAGQKVIAARAAIQGDKP
jgi:hypothetical protein